MQCATAASILNDSMEQIFFYRVELGLTDSAWGNPGFHGRTHEISIQHEEILNDRD